MLKIAWNKLYAHPLPEGHRFPMEKYNLIPEQLLYEGTISANDIYEPGFLEDEHIFLAHHRDYWDKLKYGRLTASEIRKTGFPWSNQLVEREVSIARGSIDMALYALENGVGMNVAGGTHHAFSDRGEGFCLLNDFAITALYLLKKQLAKKILIADLDVHQGNGSAAILRQYPDVFTFSMHGAHNYPLQKEQSDLDVPLPDKTGDEDYLSILMQVLPGLIDRFKPDIVFYLSGVDVLETDKLGRLAMTINGCKQRDRIVFEECNKRSLPVLVSMGGGYSVKLSDIVEAHANTYRIAKEVYY